MSESEFTFQGYSVKLRYYFLSPLMESNSLQRRRLGFGPGKWLATVASIWIQCTSGSSYAFGIYSPVLKSSQKYDQSTLDSVAVFKDIGANFGLLSGLLYSAVFVSHSPSSSSSTSCFRGGPWVVLAAGAIQCFLGYFLMWLSIVGAVPRPPVPLMCLYMLLAAHAQTFFNTANVVSAVENFPHHRGTVVGIMKGFLGLSGAILIQVYRTIYEGKPSSFLLMLALLPTLAPFTLMCFVNVYDTHEVQEKKYLNQFSLISLIIAFYLMVLIILENIQSFGLITRIITFLVLIVLLMSPLSVALKAQLKDSSRHPEITHLVEDPDLMDPLVQRRSEILADEKMHPKHEDIAYFKSSTDDRQESSSHDNRKIGRGENLNLLQAMSTIDFWVLFLAMACAMGSGLATVNNISQIGGSLGYTSIETSTLVSLWSIWNFLGRFGAGYVSDYFLHLKGYPRPLFMAVALATMGVGHAVIASGLPGALYAGSVLVGVCYGSQWSLMPTITSEIFGLKHMGTIFNTIAIASPIGSYLLSVRVVGYIYDLEAASAGESTCTGKHCFMLSFLIMASVSLLGFVFALLLFFRTRMFYKQVIFARLQHF
ncbi:protein NUCLEAR FUSION DEFECTIVE 4 [Aristolochia californica]|uniref:protein NUCLEAR FUSION DEFECTIVE 4 n=1 Tax=Aristolochia californica TaxID=171875 RepID=UPI0035D6EB0C